jgi:16S rRNA (uracil1498-N3)-methyltransferase
MVERVRASGLATFFAPEPPVAGTVATLGDDAAHHLHVRRIGPSERIRLTDGAGTIATGVLVRLTKTQAAVAVEEVERIDPLPEVHLLVPIADRDRMLWLSEKSTELGATTWRPVLWRRSRSVTPRGEGTAFQAKIRARMIAALEQSGGAWLPALYPDAPLERAITATPAGTRLLLDAEGGSMASISSSPPLTIAIGPEGGLDDSERDALLAAGFSPVSIATNILRFETAAIAGLAIARASLGTVERIDEP